MSKRRKEIVPWSALVLFDLIRKIPLDPFEDVIDRYYYQRPTRAERLSRYKRARQCLREKRYIRQTKHGYVLTRRGQLRATVLLSRIENRPTTWDGKWRVFIFDIPERQRNARRRLRQQLRALGFIKLHLSVWVSPFEPPRELWRFVDDMKLLPTSRLLTVEAINYDADLRKHFGVA